MTASINIIHRNTSGTIDYKGRTVESIVRRLFGTKAVIRYSADHNSPEAGMIVTPTISGGWNVQAKVLTIGGDHEPEKTPFD